MSRTWDPSKWSTDAQKHGSAGLIWNGPTNPGSLTNGSSGQGWNFDPRYMREVQDYSSEGGGQKSFEFTDHYNQLFNGGNDVQIRDLKRLKDQNAAKWGGDEVGWLTSKDNYTDDTDWVDKAFETASFAAIGAAPFLHMAGLGQFGSTAQNWLNPGGANGGGGLGLTGGDLPYGTEMPNTYAPGADPTSFYEPLGAEMDPFGPNGGLDPETWALNSGEGLPAGATSAATGGIPDWLRSAGSFLMSNPQLLGMLGGLAAGSGNNNGTSGGDQFEGVPVQYALPKEEGYTANAHNQRQLADYQQMMSMFGGR